MWYLVNRQTGDQTQCLLCNRSYKIGRVQAAPAANPDIALDGDTSISRSHAELLIKFTESQVAQLDSAPSAVLTDLSKFGTFVNDTRVDEFHALSPDDLIRFGRNNCYFHLRHTPLTVTTSCVAAANRPALRQLLCQLGGHLLADWHNSCSFVVMDKLTVTVKVIAALVSQKFIVTPKYFEDLVRKADNWQGTAGVVKEQSRADPCAYLPALAEDEADLAAVDFRPNPLRSTLFKGRTFVFFTGDDLGKMQNVIELAGGRCAVFSRSQHLREGLVDDSWVFVESSSDTVGLVDEAKRTLEAQGRRLVDQAEIGLAVLFASTEKHCSPWSVNKEEAAVRSEFRIDTQTLTHEAGEHAWDQINSDTQYNDLVMAAFDTQDTAPFEYERVKINETVKVVDTPERKRNRLPVIMTGVAEKEQQFQPVVVVAVENTQEIREAERSRLMDDLVRPGRLETAVTAVVKKEVVEEIEVADRKPEQLVGYVKSKGLVLSKGRPENCEVRNGDAENGGSQLRVKFESLVKKESVQSEAAGGEETARRNFKKFMKVPKKLSSSSGSKVHGKEKGFKSVCKSEPFDVNSQFDSFMKSMR